jgi:hypothetical protein
MIMRKRRNRNEQKIIIPTEGSSVSKDSEEPTNGTGEGETNTGPDGMDGEGSSASSVS